MATSVGTVAEFRARCAAHATRPEESTATAEKPLMTASKPEGLSPAPNSLVNTPFGPSITTAERLPSLATKAASPALQTLSPKEWQERLSWRVPRLQFTGTPLSEVVALFRTHGNVRLQLADASLGHVRVSGVLRADNSDALLRLLAADHAIVAESEGDEILLRRAR